MLSNSSLVRRTYRVVALWAVASFVAVTPARAQVGAYAGCTLYACYDFRLTEVARSGPMTPFPGGPPPGTLPLNVPSYLVQYQMDVRATVLQQAIDDGVTTVMPHLPWFFNDGAFGDGGCCVSFGVFALGGHSAGTRLFWSTVNRGLPDMSGFVAVDAPDGTAGVAPGMFGFELFQSAADPFGFQDLAIAPTATVTPEPTAMLLVATGLGMTAFVRRRRSERRQSSLLANVD